MKKFLSNIRWLAPVAVMLIVYIVGGITYAVKTADYKHWATTEADIIEIQHLVTDSRDDSRVGFSYEVNGKWYIGHENLDLRNWNISVGDIRDIWYDTRNPGRSAITSPSPTFEAMCILMFLTPLVIFSIIKTVNSMRPPVVQTPRMR